MIEKLKKIKTIIVIGLILFLMSNVSTPFQSSFQTERNHEENIKSSAVTVLWSVDITSSSSDYSYISPALGDIDNNGDLEVIVGCEGGAERIIALNAHDGSELWYYDGPDLSSMFIDKSSPALADVDGDHNVDVIIGAGHPSRSVVALDGENGNELWYYDSGLVLDSSPTIGDTDGDGKLEVVIGILPGIFYTLNAEDGSFLWSFTTGGGDIRSSAAIADIDEDGAIEVIIGGYNGSVYSLNGSNGNEEWMFQTDNVIFSSPCIADVDEDGKLEVIISSGDTIYAINGEDGSSEWNYTAGNWAWSTPAIADVDGDGRLEIVIGYDNGEIHSVNGEDGSLGWNFTTGGAVRSSPSIGDVDDDSKLEVVIGSYDDYVYAINGENGTISWSYDTGYNVFAAPVLGDIDGDGFLEVIAVATDGLVLALNPSPSGKRIEWQGFAGGNMFTRKKSQRVFDLDQDWLSFYSELKYFTGVLDPDFDDDGMLDGWEVTHGFNPASDDASGDIDGDGVLNLYEHNNHTDPNDSDSDDDGLLDLSEIVTHLTDPNNNDTDNDGLEDGPEVSTHFTDPLDDDSDDDDLLDGEEVLTYLTYPNDSDSEDDEMPDGWEVSHNLAPLIDDSAGDPDVDLLINIYEYGNNTDPQDPDSEDDGMPDGWEMTNSLDPLLDDSTGDPDVDLLFNIYEYGNNTDPQDSDSEDDGMPDGWEVSNSLNPLIDDTAGDPDVDGISNIDEYTIGTDPNVFNPIPQLIAISSPISLHLYGITTISFIVELTDIYLDSYWYTLVGSGANVTFINNGTISQILWESFGSGDLIIIFYANDTFGRESFDSVQITKDVDPPIVSIQDPTPGETFYVIPPEYEITVTEPHFNSMWYTLDGGLTNTSIVDYDGSISQSIWDLIPVGSVTIRFYAQDSVGNIGFTDILVTKDSVSEPPPGGGIPGYIPQISLTIITIAVIILLLRARRKLYI